MQQVENKTAGMIVSICYTPESTKNIRPEDHYARTPIESVELVAGRGIDGDRKGRFGANTGNRQGEGWPSALPRKRPSLAAPIIGKLGWN